MDDTKKNRPSLIIIFGGIGLLFSLFALAALWSHDQSPIPMKDFVEYWSAGKAFLDHGNPYDPVLLRDLQRVALNEPKLREPVMMWNPPWALILMAPLGALSPKSAHIVWLIAQFVCVLASIALLQRVYSVPKECRLASYAVGLVFCPLFLLLWYGQIGGFCLLGLAGFLFFDQRDRPVTAGICASLTALKPHLLFAFGLVLILDAIVSQRGRKTLFGGVLALISAALVVWLLHPMVYAQYFESISAPSSDAHYSVRDWKTPLVGYWIRIYIDPQNFWIQFLPTLIASAVVVVVWTWFRNQLRWQDWLPWLVLISAICAAYGSWIFDLIVLLVPVMQSTARISKVYTQKRKTIIMIAVVYVIFNLASSLAPVYKVMLTGEGVGIHHYIFFAPVILLFYLICRRISCGTNYGR